MANGFAEISINPNDTCSFSAEDELTLEVDTTSNALYVYYSQSYLAEVATTDANWRCFRVTVANGSKRWAKDPVTGKATREFKLQASAAATYTY